MTDVSLTPHLQTLAARLKAWFGRGRGARTRSLTIDISKAGTLEFTYQPI